MGVLQRFERRLEGLVEGAFARAFRSTVQPVEIASALQRETSDRAAIVGPGRTLVPNDFVVELGPTDHDRLAPYADTLGEEFAGMMREHAAEEGYSHVGPVKVSFAKAGDLDTGTFRIRSDVVRGPLDPALPRGGGAVAPQAGERRSGDRRGGPGKATAAAAPEAAPEAAAVPGGPRLVSNGGTPKESAYDLTAAVTVIGRGEQADLRLADPGVSRRHAELRREGGDVVLTDLGSTNGTLVNGKQVEQATLREGDRVTIGETTLVFATGRERGRR